MRFLVRSVVRVSAEPLGSEDFPGPVTLRWDTAKLHTCEYQVVWLKKNPKSDERVS